MGGRGGGIAVLAGAASVVRSTIAENSGKAYSRGGGVYVEGSSVVSIETSTISHNYADFAGGLYIGGASQVTATNTTISNNSGLWLASGVQGSSGVTLEYVTVANNRTFQGK